MKNKKYLKILVSIFLFLTIFGCIAACSKSEETNKNEVNKDAFQEEVDVQDDNVEQQEETNLVGMKDEDQEESFESDAQEDVTDTTGKEENNESKVKTPSKEATTSSTKKEENEKPSTSQSSTDRKPSNDSSKNESSTSKETSKTETPAHTHSWQEVKTVVKHEEVGHYENVCVKEAWTEEKPVYETVCLSICNVCGEDITGNTGNHEKQHALKGEGGGWHAEYVKKKVSTETIQHDAVYEQQWVVDKESWTETVISYKCSCGTNK